jgi:hypothetical protein
VASAEVGPFNEEKKICDQKMRDVILIGRILNSEPVPLKETLTISFCFLNYTKLTL